MLDLKKLFIVIILITISLWALDFTTGQRLSTLFIQSLNLRPGSTVLKENPPNQKGEVINDVRLAYEEEGAKVPLAEIQKGCFGGKDCIASIDQPVFETLAQADLWLEPSDRVIILEFEGLTKVYPQRILNRHEIVNDWFGDTPIAISYCPLCGSAVAFQRIVDGKITQFGVSGYLHNSDLVMYDRLEGSLWQQITGEAITGPAARRDEKIKPILLIVLPWAEASSKYPRAEVLSRDTGLPESSYNTYPYGDYETDDAVYFPVSGNDNRLHSKAWVYGIEINGQTAAFEENKLKPGKQTYEVGSLIVEVTYENDIASFKNQETGEEIVPLKLFWFAWASFNPDTLLF